MTYAAVGEFAGGRGNIAPGGYIVSCKCGWTKGPLRGARMCQLAYADHLQSIKARTCATCGTSFHRSKTPSSGNLRCPACQRAWAKAYRDEQRLINPQAQPFRSRRSGIRKKYGLSLEDVELMLDFQNQSCAACGDRFPDRDGASYQIDHCHKTGRVRGLLCASCNRGLGAFNDNAAAMLGAIRYLERDAANHKGASNSG